MVVGRLSTLNHDGALKMVDALVKQQGSAYDPPG